MPSSPSLGCFSSYLDYCKHHSRTKLIASGGVRSLEDVNVALQLCDAVIVGKALLEGDISLQHLENAVVKHHISGKTKRIIPCLDIKNGRIVKGIKFKQLRDAGNPVELARMYDDEGADELVFLDITATIESRRATLKMIRSIAEKIYIQFTVGGGIRSLGDMTEIIQAGAEKVSINSATVKNPDLITEGARKFGSQCIVVAIDAKKTPNGWETFINAGATPTGIDSIQWAREAVQRGAGELLVTSIDHDGTQEGYDLELLHSLRKTIDVPIIMSGGAGTMKHFKDVLENGADAALAASLFHQQQLKIKDLKRYLHEQGLPMRIN